MNQKRRTRAALVQAAQRLLDQGRTPTVADVADEALVSRATAYRYFPSQEHLLLEVVLERSIDEINQQVQVSAGSGDAAARLEGLVSAIYSEIATNEAGFRSLLQLSIAQSPSDQPRVAGIRGERRLSWIEQAVEPIAADLDEGTRRRLVYALTLCVGTEGFVVLHDLCSLGPIAAEETLRWAALAMLSAATSGRGTSAGDR